MHQCVKTVTFHLSKNWGNITNVTEQREDFTLLQPTTVFWFIQHLNEEVNIFMYVQKTNC